MNKYTIEINGREIPIFTSYQIVLKVENEQYAEVKTHVQDNQVRSRTTITSTNYFWISNEEGVETRISESREFNTARAGQYLSFLCDNSNRQILSVLNHNTKTHSLYKPEISVYYGLAKNPKDTGWAIFGILALFGIVGAIVGAIFHMNGTEQWTVIGIFEIVALLFSIRKYLNDEKKKENYNAVEKLFANELLKVATFELNNRK